MQARRYEALDGLRGVAAFLVIFHHVRWNNHTLGLTIVENAYLAVDLFFILSGFVIAASYFDRIAGAADARDFMLMRIFRVYPLHLAILVGLLALEFAKYAAAPDTLSAEGPFSANSPQALFANLLLVQSWGVLDRLTWNLPSWSISAEFGAYLAFAGVMASGLGLRKGFWPIAAIVVALVYPALALWRGTLDITYDFGLVRCLCGFTLGVYLHQLKTARPAWFGRWTDLVLLASIVTVMACLSGALAAIVGVALMTLLVASLRDDDGALAGILRSRPLQWLGAISYSVYMVHVPIRIVLLNVLERLGFRYDGNDLAMNVWTGDLITLGYLAVVLVVACVTYKLIEEPGRRLGRAIVRRDRTLVGARAAELSASEAKR